MSNILDQIVSHKIEEVFSNKKILSESALKDTATFNRSCLSLTHSLLAPAASGIIAEFKRKSPSKGFINQYADATKVTKSYANAGASGLSVLTDNFFFGGSPKDLQAARNIEIPILRKDFIVDLYQVTETKAMGADVLLLIAACLTKSQTEELAIYAKETGLEVLLELHDESELGHICKEVDMVGINNRSLKTFEVDINRSIALAELLPKDKCKIAESGISGAMEIRRFRNSGFKGFLIGENFMKTSDPGTALQQLIQEIEKK